MSKQTSTSLGEPRERANTLAPRFARSGQMIECLKREWIYSEKRPRDMLFGAVEQLIHDRPVMMASQLGREATVLATLWARDVGFAFDNWDAAGRAVLRTLLMAGVLRSVNDDAIGFDITGQAARVGGLQPDFRDVAEAFLLEFLIGRLGDVTTKDHTALAHALFRQFDHRVRREALEDRVVILLARLVDRIVLVGDVYVLRPRGPSSPN